jgi:hypothetical protein
VLWLKALEDFVIKLLLDAFRKEPSIGFKYQQLIALFYEGNPSEPSIEDRLAKPLLKAGATRRLA